jgi:hypothetical protein
VKFKRACDTAPREKLWAELEGVGVGRGCCARPGGYTDPFPLRRRRSLVDWPRAGLLSPTLFDIYIDCFERVVLAQAALPALDYKLQ